MDLKTIDRNIASIKASSTKLRDKVQDVGVAIIQHSIEHGDCTRALALVKAIGSSANQRNLIKWFAYCGGIGMNVEQDKVSLIKKDAKRYVQPSVDYARANPWYTFVDPRDGADEPLPVTLTDVREVLYKAIDRAERLIKDEERGLKNADQLDRCQRALRQLRGLLVQEFPKNDKGEVEDVNVPTAGTLHPRSLERQAEQAQGKPAETNVVQAESKATGTVRKGRARQTEAA